MALPSPSPHSPQQRPMEYASPPPSPSHVSRGDSFLESVTPIPHAKNLHPMLGLSSFGDGDGDGDEGDCARDGGGGYVSVNGDGDLTSPDSGMLTGEGIALGPAPPGYYGSDMTCTPATDNTSHTAAAQNAAALTAVARSSADLAVPRLGGGSDDRLGIDFGWGLSECVPLGSLSRLSQPPAAARGRSYTDPAMATLTGFEFRSGSTFGSTPSTAPPSSPPPESVISSRVSRNESPPPHDIQSYHRSHSEFVDDPERSAGSVLPGSGCAGEQSVRSVHTLLSNFLPAPPREGQSVLHIDSSGSGTAENAVSASAPHPCHQQLWPDAGGAAAAAAPPRSRPPRAPAAASKQPLPPVGLSLLPGPGGTGSILINHRRAVSLGDQSYLSVLTDPSMDYGCGTDGAPPILQLPSQSKPQLQPAPLAMMGIGGRTAYITCNGNSNSNGAKKKHHHNVSWGEFDLVSIPHMSSSEAPVLSIETKLSSSPSFNVAAGLIASGGAPLQPILSEPDLSLLQPILSEDGSGSSRDRSGRGGGGDADGGVGINLILENGSAIVAAAAGGGDAGKGVGVTGVEGALASGNAESMLRSVGGAGLRRTAAVDGTVDSASTATMDLNVSKLTLSPQSLRGSHMSSRSGGSLASASVSLPGRSGPDQSTPRASGKGSMDEAVLMHIRRALERHQQKSDEGYSVAYGVSRRGSEISDDRSKQRNTADAIRDLSSQLGAIQTIIAQGEIMGYIKRARKSQCLSEGDVTLSVSCGVTPVVQNVTNKQQNDGRRDPTEMQNLPTAEMLQDKARPKEYHFSSSFDKIFIPTILLVAAATLLHYLDNSAVKGRGSQCMLEPRLQLQWMLSLISQQSVVLVAVLICHTFFTNLMTSCFSGLVRLCSPLTTQVALECRGWPSALFMWVLIQITVLQGQLYPSPLWPSWDRIIGVETSGDVCVNMVTIKPIAHLLIIAVVSGILGVLKRVCLSYYLGKINFEHYAPELKAVLQDTLALTKVACLAHEMKDTFSQCSDPGSTDTQFEFSQDDQFNSISETAASKSYMLHRGQASQNHSILAGSNHFDPTKDQKSESNVLSSNRHVSALRDSPYSMNLSNNLKRKIQELVQEREMEEINFSSNDSTFKDIQDFQQILTRLKINGPPLSSLFGDTGRREHVISSLQVAFEHLFLFAPASELLPFSTLCLTCLDENGNLSEDVVRHLLRLFRPCRDGHLNKVHFVESCEAVHNTIRIFQDKYANAMHLNVAFERIISSLFHFIHFVFLLVIVNPNLGFALLGLALLFAFMFGNAASEYFQGFFFVFTQRPFDLGDHIVLSNINAGTSRNELDTYFVEGFDLSSTTLKCVTTHKIVFVRNNALANYEIINLSRSPKAQVKVHLRLAFGVTPEKIQIFKFTIESFVEKRPKEWMHLAELNLINIQARQGFVEYAVVLVHREKWKNSVLIMQSKMELVSFAAEVAKKLDMNFIA